MTEIERLDKEIHEQREENFGLYSIFQYRLQEEVMQPLIKEWRVQFTTPSGLHSVLERPFSEANGRPFLVKRSPLIVC